METKKDINNISKELILFISATSSCEYKRREKTVSENDFKFAIDMAEELLDAIIEMSEYSYKEVNQIFDRAGEKEYFYDDHSKNYLCSTQTMFETLHDFEGLLYIVYTMKLDLLDSLKNYRKDNNITRSNWQEIDFKIDLSKFG